MKIIEMKNVGFAYKSEDESTVAAEDVSLDIEQGEFFVLLGHNGCGKSTLAKLMNGLLLPTEGTVTSCGFDTKQEDKTYYIRSKIGMVFQNPDNQTVASVIEDDVAFGPENLGVERNEIIRRVRWALEKTGMSEYAAHTPFKLSGGQKQRVAIASVLAMLPDVLILDESTAMLDPEGRDEVLSTVKKLNRENGMTVVLITHYMDEAVSADRIAVMNHGRIVALGTPKEIFGNLNLIKECKLELPVAGLVSHRLASKGIAPVLTDEELAEEICRLL